MSWQGETCIKTPGTSAFQKQSFWTTHIKPLIVNINRLLLFRLTETQRDVENGLKNTQQSKAHHNTLQWLPSWSVVQGTGINTLLFFTPSKSHSLVIWMCIIFSKCIYTVCLFHIYIYIYIYIYISFF